jgi:hypothetical protein
MKLRNLFFLLLLVPILFTACSGTDPEIPNEEELITSFKINLISEDGKDSIEWSFDDIDGDGGEEPIISVTSLKENTTYNATISISNETINPVQNITEEVLEEGTSHQLFYVVNGPELTVTYDDEDLDGNPLGLKIKMKTGKESIGGLKVILRHEPIKPNNGDPKNAEGETDIEIDFFVAIG